MADPLAARGLELERLRGLARRYIGALSQDITVRAAVVVGSVARGDFNVWSDVDVLVVADRLPDRTPERAALLVKHAPPRVQPIGFTPDEFERAVRRRNPLAVEALSAGVVLRGEAFFGQLRSLSR